MPRLSILIPASGGADLLEDTLVSVLENRPEDCEVIVVHGGSYEDPYDLKDEVHFIQLQDSAGLLMLLRAGVEAARADVLHVLASGVRVEHGWTEPALAHFADPRMGAVAPVLLRADEDRVISAGVSYGSGGKRRLCGFGLQGEDVQLSRTPITGPAMTGAFYRRCAVQAAGGIPLAVGEQLADVDLGLSLRAIGYHSVVEPACRLLDSCPDRLSTGEWDKTIGPIRRGLYAQRLFWRHAPTLGWTRALLSEPAAVLMQLLANFPRLSAGSLLLGRVLACLDIFHYRRHYSMIQQAPRPRSNSTGCVGDTTWRVDRKHVFSEVRGQRLATISQQITDN